MSEKLVMPKIPWGRGTLPSWISVLLLSVIAYFGKHTLDEFDGLKLKLLNTSERVTVLEVENKTVQLAIIELRLGQKDVISELKTINNSLQQQRR